MARKPYATDLTDDQWAMIEPLLPAAKPGGRPRTTDLRDVVNTLLYQNRTGCQYDLLPHDLLPKSTVYEYFAQWRDDGTWQVVLDVLRQGLRAVTAASEQPDPSASYCQILTGRQKVERLHLSVNDGALQCLHAHTSRSSQPGSFHVLG